MSNEDILIRTRVSTVKKMELDWACVKNGGFQALHGGNDMEAGWQKRVGRPKITWRRTVEKENK